MWTLALFLWVQNGQAPGHGPTGRWDLSAEQEYPTKLECIVAMRKIRGFEHMAFCRPGSPTAQ